MLQVPGYNITGLIHEGSSTRIYRAKHSETGMSVAIKVPKGEYPTPRELVTFHQECLLLRGLNVRGVIKTFGMERYGNGLALILEDLPGQSLASLIRSQRPDLSMMLRIAINLVEILQGVHNSGVIHRDLKPHNIIVELGALGPSVHLIDFGSACRTASTTKPGEDVPVPEASLAYISPEQTGRTNRSVDYRTDYYSLGVTLYELLTGTLPFTTLDPMELVHSHLARIPLQPSQLVPSIPEQLSAVVMRLLAKTPEGRYQSAHGIRADLEQCLSEWEATGAIAPFPLAKRDHSTDLRLSQKLYGRSTELARLSAALNRAAEGEGQLVLLSGSPGVGKSALGQELARVVTQQGALFGFGRVERNNLTAPYAALLHAFRDLCQQLLAESQEQLATWRAALTEAVGANGRLLTEFVPELELIIGVQPALATVGLSEAQNRFNLVVQSFLQVFASAEHPLVLFLDDLHFADTATVALLRVLVADIEHSHLLIVGSYRDDDTSTGWPLRLELTELRSKSSAVQIIELLPLTLDDVYALLSELLSCTPERVAQLALVLYEKTHGNPFFINQFLVMLHHEGLLRFDFAQESWQWNLAEIQNRQVTDNVVTFTLGKIRLLSESTQRILQLAACIGNQFDLETLRLLDSTSPQEIAAAIWDAQHEGLCIPVESAAHAQEDAHTAASRALDRAISFRFLHDRVQQAAYSLMPESEQVLVHLAIAKLLLERNSGQVEDSVLFELATHFVRGASALHDLGERLQAAQVHLRAGKRAKHAAAFEVAGAYLVAGVELLLDSSWEANYELTFELHIELAECSYLGGQLEQAEAIFEILQSKLRSALDAARLATLRIELYSTKGVMEKALHCGLEALAELEIRFPETPAEHAVALPLALEEFGQLIGARSIAALADLPACTEQQQRMIQRLLLGTCTPAFFVRPSLMPLLVMKLATLSLQHGNTEFTSYAHVSYAVIAANVLGRYSEAYEFGKLGLSLNRKFENSALECRLNGLFAGFVNIYQKPLHSSTEYLQAGIKAGLESGDSIFVGYCCFHAITQLLGAGDELSLVSQEIEKLRVVARRAHEPFALGALSVTQQAILNLTGQTQGRGSLTSPEFDEDFFAASIAETEFTTLQCWYYSLKLQLAYIYGDYEAAHKWAQLAESRTAGTLGLHFVTDLSFFRCLTLLGLGHQPSSDDAAGAELRRLSAQLQQWAECCPANYRHKYSLVLAEIARVRGSFAEALDLYDQAISQANDTQFVHHSAIASELCARFLLKHGRSRLATVYLRDAYYGFERWGAVEKVAQLVEAFPALQKDALLFSAREQASSTITTSSSLTNGGFLDIATVLHAAQSIASEMRLERLLDQVLRLVVANAGAQRGFLLLEMEGKLIIQASITVSPDTVLVGLDTPLENSDALAHSIVQLVAHTRETVLLANASQDSRYANDPYVLAHKPKSVLCLALKNRGRLTGVLYLENNIAEDAFTAERVELLRLLSGQAASAVDNAILYSRSLELSEKLRGINDELRTANSELTQRSNELRRANSELLQRSEDLRHANVELTQRSEELHRANTELTQRSDELRQANLRTQEELAERVRIERERANLQEEVIRIQNARLAEIAAPLIPITDQIMVMPLIGTMDTERAQQMLQTVLHGAQQHRARVVIIDITGLKHVDTNVASMLLNAASALRLLGTQAILTGIRAEIAQTLISLGIDLGSVVTRGTLQSGIAYAASQRGMLAVGDRG